MVRPSDIPGDDEGLTPDQLLDYAQFRAQFDDGSAEAEEDFVNMQDHLPLPRIIREERWHVSQSIN